MDNGGSPRQWFKELAKRLFDNGYTVLPAVGKKVLVQDWTRKVINGELVTYWATNGEAGQNIGGRMGNQGDGMILAAADMDILNKELCRAVQASFEARFGLQFPCRGGKPPKRALLFRLDTEIVKAVSPTWVDPEGVEHKVEILCKGQQMILYGTHPDTNKPYLWLEVETRGQPSQMETWELPEIRAEDLLDWLHRDLPALIPAGWAVRGTSKTTLPDPTLTMAPEERALANYKRPLDLDDEQVRAIVEKVDPECHYDDWMEIGLAIHHQYGGSEEGFEIWDEQSARSSKYSAEVTRYKWESMRSDPSRGRIKTLASWIKAQNAEEKERIAEVVMPTWDEQIAEAADIDALREVAKAVAGVATSLLDDLQREEVARKIADRGKELGTPIPIAKVRKAIQYKPSASLGGGAGGNVLRLKDFGANGNVLCTRANVEAILAAAGITVRYNLIRKADEILIPGASFSVDNVDEASFVTVMDLCARVEMPTHNLMPYLRLISDENQYNPALIWIESKPWDGVSRLQRFYDTVIESAGFSKPHKETLLFRWLMGAIKALVSPDGVDAQGVIILQGKQGIGKSTWVKSLVTPDVSFLVREGAILDVHNKDSLLEALTCWICELAEVGGTLNRSEQNAFKAFMTKVLDKIRLPYAKAASNFPRRTVFIGTENELAFLKDETGSRRMWSISVEGFVKDAELDMQQVWAECLAIYRTEGGEGVARHWLTLEEQAHLETTNDEFKVADPIDELISTHFDWEAAANGDCQWEWRTATEIAQMVGILQPQAGQVIKVGRSVGKRNGKNRRKSNGTQFLAVPEKTAVRDFGRAG